MTAILDAPMTADGVREPLHVHSKATDVVANLNRRFPVAKALRYHHADRLQTAPLVPPRQVLRHRQLDVAPRLLTPMPLLLSHMPLGRHLREVRRALLVDV